MKMKCLVRIGSGEVMLGCDMHSVGGATCLHLIADSLKL